MAIWFRPPAEHLLLQQPDEGAKVPFPGLFFYTPGIPATILANISTPIGQVNGARGTASGISVDPTGTYTHDRLLDTQLTPWLLAEFFEIDDLYVLCTKPPICVFFQQNNSKLKQPNHPTFKDLEVDVND